jgi:hypothetical protein
MFISCQMAQTLFLPGDKLLALPQYLFTANELRFLDTNCVKMHTNHVENLPCIEW